MGQMRQSPDKNTTARKRRSTYKNNKGEKSSSFGYKQLYICLGNSVRSISLPDELTKLFPNLGDFEVILDSLNLLQVI